jgi:hypothetical protein
VRYEYFTEKTLENLILKYSWGSGKNGVEKATVAGQRRLFLDLLLRIFAYNPSERITPTAALQHPFLLADLTA